jgi:hypothetical protein
MGSEGLYKESELGNGACEESWFRLKSFASAVIGLWLASMSELSFVSYIALVKCYIRKLAVSTLVL